jgi:hypothetical protein
MSPKPRAYFGAAPTEPARVPTLTRRDGVSELLEHPPSARGSGWNMLTLDRAVIVEGSRLRVSNGERKHLDLLDDGSFLAIASFEGFLSWGPHHFPEDPKINSVALIEFTYEFVAFYAQLVNAYVEPRPQGVRFEIGIDAAIFIDDAGVERKLYLIPGGINAFPPPRLPEAPAAQFATSYDLLLNPDEGIDVPAVAFEIVRRFYNWFGLKDDDVPYTMPDGAAIDIDAIKTLN